MEHSLDDRDRERLAALCDRIGLVPVLRALAARCAFESHGNTNRSKQWDEAFRALHQAAQIVAELSDG